MLVINHIHTLLVADFISCEAERLAQKVSVPTKVCYKSYYLTEMGN